MVVKVLQSGTLTLKPLEEKYLHVLHNWRNEEQFLKLCSIRKNFVGFEEFRDELVSDFKRDRHQQFVLELLNINKQIGTIWSYNLNLIDGYVFISIYVDKDHQGKGYGIIALALFVKYLFNFFPIFKIYVEVYGYNMNVNAIIEKIGAIKEGIFTGHHIFEGNRYDLLRYALYEDVVKKAERIVDYFSERGGDNRGLVKW
jgi:[ribosomal protein S5]-alanine N-acetyltransferase